LSYSFFDRNRTGVLLARVTNDLFEIVELAHHGPENILTCSITIVGALVILLTINPLLTMVLIIMLPACVIFGMRQRLNMQAANREVKKRTGEINAAIESGISGIRTSKAFANEEAEDAKFDEANEAFKASLKEVIELGDYNLGFMELKQGTVDAIAADIGVAAFQIAKNGSDYVMLDEAISTEQYAVGFLLGNTELRDAVNAELKAMAEDGTMLAIAQNYVDAGLVIDSLCLID
jgi:ABC-type multidrug transport system fused ATPase/permease subunit